MENPNDRNHHRPLQDARQKAPTNAAAAAVVAAAAAFCSVQVLKIRAKNEQQIYFIFSSPRFACVLLTC